MEFTTYVRRPFVVQAVEVTTANIAEVATLVGELNEKRDGTPYIMVNPELVPNVERVYPGYYMTKMGDNVRCYSRRVFREQFMEKNEENRGLFDYVEHGL